MTKCSAMQKASFRQNVAADYLFNAKKLLNWDTSRSGYTMVVNVCFSFNYNTLDTKLFVWDLTLIYGCK